MICKLFVFRHAQTFDNYHGVFSGWRDSGLTPKGFLQAETIADQLKGFTIDFGFSSHLKRASQTLEVVLRHHPSVRVFVDDRLIERCYGVFQGVSKKMLRLQDPGFFEEFHRGYSYIPEDGESLKMVEDRVTAFFGDLKAWLRRNPGNVAISCHNNSIRPLRRVFEKLSAAKMCQLESRQDKTLVDNLNLSSLGSADSFRDNIEPSWEGTILPKSMKLASSENNSLRKYYT
jgi:2,3-bisphosphoglycerate-dependent phosphoglycerate mutase